MSYKSFYGLSFSDKVSGNRVFYYILINKKGEVSSSISYYPQKKKSEKTKEWRHKNPEHARKLYRYNEYRRQYRKNNMQKFREYNKKFRRRNKEKLRAFWSLRRRNLGFIPLNEIFEGAEAHHIDYNYVIFLPKELHRSIYHCIFTGQNMEKINKVAFDFLLNGGKK